MTEIAKAQIRAGDLIGAKHSIDSVLRHIEPFAWADPPIDTLLSLAEAQAEAGDDRGATRTINMVHDQARRVGGSSKASAYSNISVTEAKVGLMESARQTLKKARDALEAVTDPYFRVAGMADIAAAETIAADKVTANRTFEAALEATNHIDRPASHDLALGHLSHAQARAGNLEQALTTVIMIEEAFSRSRSLANIANAQSSHEKARIMGT